MQTENVLEIETRGRKLAAILPDVRAVAYYRAGMILHATWGSIDPTLVPRELEQKRALALTEYLFYLVGKCEILIKIRMQSVAESTERWAYRMLKDIPTESPALQNLFGETTIEKCRNEILEIINVIRKLYESENTRKENEAPPPLFPSHDYISAKSRWFGNDRGFSEHEMQWANYNSVHSIVKRMFIHAVKGLWHLEDTRQILRTRHNQSADDNVAGIGAFINAAYSELTQGLAADLHESNLVVVGLEAARVSMMEAERESKRDVAMVMMAHMLWSKPGPNRDVPSEIWQNLSAMSHDYSSSPLLKLLQDWEPAVFDFTVW